MSSLTSPSASSTTRSSSTNAGAAAALYSSQGHDAIDLPIPSNIDLLLRNLRFLDLDRHPDWPDVNAHTFRTGKDAHLGQKERVKTAEWVLVKLFELWSPKEAKTKLGALFPALEPRQSIQLRANLFAWLTDLKAAGLLGRDCLLRKSTLDECRGEKLEEMLFLVSAAVLKKTVQEHNTGVARGGSKSTGRITVAEQLTTSKHVDESEMNTMRVLEVALERSLRKDMLHKETMRERYFRLQDELDVHLAQMDARAEDALTRTGRYAELAMNDHLDVEGSKGQLREQCAGSQTWLSVLISGDGDTGRSTFIEDEWDQIWDHNRHDTTKSYGNAGDADPGMLADLDARVSAQRQRLKEWRGFQMQLSKRNEAYIVPRTPSKFTPSRTPFKSPAKSTRANPAASPGKSQNRPPPSPEKTTRALAQSRGIVNGSMRNAQPRPKSMHLEQTAIKLSQVIASGKGDGADEARDVQHLPTTVKPTTTTTSGEATELEEKMANLNLKTMSDEKKHALRGNEAASNAMTNKPKPEIAQADEIVEPHLDPPTVAGVQESFPDAALGFSTAESTTSLPEPNSTFKSSQTLSERTQDSLFNAAAYSPSVYQTSPSRSLRAAEKISANDQTTIPPTVVAPEPQLVAGAQQPAPPTLAERTRESIFAQQAGSTARPPPQPPARTHRKTRSVQTHGPAYPVNPFDSAETDRDAYERELIARHASLRQQQAQTAAQAYVATPLDHGQGLAPPSSRPHLVQIDHVPFTPSRSYPDDGGDDTDYASVFKARPRLARSPPPSTQKMGMSRAEMKEWEDESPDEKEIL